MDYIKEKSLKTKLYVLVGVPGSGKTYYAKNVLMKQGKEINYVSRDEVRFEYIGEKDQYFSKEKQVFREFVKRIQSSLDSGKSTIADATHLNKSSRAKLLNSLQLNNDIEVVAVYVKASKNLCIEVNKNRTGRQQVPIDVIESMFRNSTTPKLSEGFNSIVIEERVERGVI